MRKNKIIAATLTLFSSCQAPSPPPAPLAPVPSPPAPVQEAPPESAPTSCGAQSEAARAPWARQWHGSWEDGEGLWVVGGYATSAQERCLHPAALIEAGQGHARAVPGLARWGHSVTALGERALVVGGSALDPEGSPWAPPPTLWLGPGASWEAAPDPAQASALHRATPLEDGRVLLTGGAASHEETLARAELFDPLARRWGAAAPMLERRQEHSATRLPGGDVLVVGGVRAGKDGVSARDCAEDEDCARGTWCHDAWLCVSAAPDAERWSLASGRWRSVGFPGGALANHQAVMLPGGAALIIGGRAEGEPTAAAWRYDPARDRWAAAPPLAQAREGHSATVAPDGRVWVVGGRGRCAAPCAEGPPTLASVEIYDPASDRWAAGPPLQAPRRGHEARWRGDALWIIGGQADGQSVGLIERLRAVGQK